MTIRTESHSFIHSLERTNLIQCVKCKVVSHVAVLERFRSMWRRVAKKSSSDAFTFARYSNTLRVSGPWQAILEENTVHGVFYQIHN